MSRSTGRQAGESIGVQAMDVGLKLLAPLIDAGTPLNLKTIAAAVDFAPPKAHRYLVSLIRAGLVEQDEQTGRYGLGQSAVSLGLTALGMLDKDGVGRAAMIDLRHETDHTAHFVVWGSGGPTVGAAEPSSNPGSVFLTTRLGSIFALLRTATGHVFLSYLPRETTRLLLETERQSFPITDQEIEALIARTRRHGIGWSIDGMAPGVSAIAAPVFDHTGHFVYAFSIIGQNAHFETSPEGQLANIVRAKARATSNRLGCSDAMYDGLVKGGSL